MNSLVHILGQEMYASNMLSRMIPNDGNVMHNELESEINDCVLNY